MALLNHDSLRKQISDYLRTMLDSGQLRPGEMIDQKELGERLGVSRTPLRDTMIQLEVEGLVTIVPCRGVYIKTLTRREVHDIFEVCGALDGMACELAAARLGVADVDGLSALVDRVEAMMAGGSFAGCNRYNEEFHETILDRCPNRMLVESLTGLRRRVYEFPSCDPATAADLEREVWRQHRDMVRLLQNGSPQDLGNYVRETHWRDWADNEQYLTTRFPWTAD